jgi:hypothetical protein
VSWKKPNGASRPSSSTPMPAAISNRGTQTTCRSTRPRISITIYRPAQAEDRRAKDNKHNPCLIPVFQTKPKTSFRPESPLLLPPRATLPKRRPQHRYPVPRHHRPQCPPHLDRTFPLPAIATNTITTNLGFTRETMPWPLIPPGRPHRLSLETLNLRRLQRQERQLWRRRRRGGSRGRGSSNNNRPSRRRRPILSRLEVIRRWGASMATTMITRQRV